MNASKLKKFALTVGSLLALGLSNQALSAPQLFTIDPGALAKPQLPFDATFINGFSSELLTLAGNNASGQGWLQFQSFANGSNAVLPVTSGLGVSYQLYVTFNLTDHLAPGSPAPAGAPGSVYILDTLNFKFWADPNVNTRFTAASITGGTVGNPATVDPVFTDDILLAAGNLITGTAGFNALGGVFLNSIQNFDVCTGNGTASRGGQVITTGGAADCKVNTGSKFFFKPNPFYSIAFSEFNNTSQGIQRSTDGTLVAITSASGGIDFNVPEPSSLALIGIAMVGLGLSARRRSKS